MIVPEYAWEDAMNRYIGGGLLAALILLLSSGVDRLGTIWPNFGASERLQGRDLVPVGTLPIEQAGRVVQRQGERSRAMPNSVFNTDPFNQNRTAPRTEIAPQNIPASEIRPPTVDVIPRTGGAAPATTTTGDVAPIQSDLVQPGSPGDRDLDSIPALW
jgi:hypothetical protein